MDPPGKSPPRPGTLGRDPAPGRGPDGSLPDGFRIAAPAVSLPKGGGAIAGMGEKVRAIPVIGSASVGIPLPLTPGRGGFTPALSLSYDSGAGNGPFGLGWRLSLPSIRR
ncbi:MAG: SpvB/TcaC N-terminal domain-containing protein, partial [Myxococcota bacterium]